jgi:3-methyladenine DNA glycosylase AlkD
MQDADDHASKAQALIWLGNSEEACLALGPVATGRTKFPILDRIGARLGQSDLSDADLFKALDRMITNGSVGYYVIAGSALKHRLRSDRTACLNKAAEYVITGNRWDRCDCLGERVWGSALVEDFPKTYAYLTNMIDHRNRWIRRAVGVAVHYFAKRKPDSVTEMRRLLTMLAPAFGERDRDAVKGIGWGLKTIGKYQSELLKAFLRVQTRRAHPTKLMLRKATTYLPASVKRQFIGRSAS